MKEMKPLQYDSVLTLRRNLGSNTVGWSSIKFANFDRKYVTVNPLDYFSAESRWNIPERIDIWFC